MVSTLWTRLLVYAGLILALASVFCAPAWAQADDAADTPPLPERLVPPPKRPVISAPPTGVTAPAWKTWASEQKITRTERVTLTLSFGPILDAMGQCTNSFDDNSYSSLFTPILNASLDAGFVLMPMLNFYVGGFAHILAGNDFSAGGGAFQFNSDGMEIFGFNLGVRIKFPVRLIGRRLFRISNAECGYGFVPYLRFGLGISKFSNVDFTEETSWTDIRFFEDSTSLMFVFGLGLEMRWRVFGLSAEFNYWSLGTPEFASGISNQKADSVKPLTINLSLNFYF